MTGPGFNHYAPREKISLAMIEGTKITALCGVEFTPKLRVGSSGKSDDPKLPICPVCAAGFVVNRERNEVIGEINRLVARRDALADRLDAIAAGTRTSKEVTA